MDPYSEAHLFVAAIRICRHKTGVSPLLEDVCQLLDISSEAGHAICRNLKKCGIIDTMEDPFSLKLDVAAHLEIENLPRKAQEENSLARELERFQAKKKGAEKKFADIQAELSKKKQDMLADIEAKFKKEMEKSKKG